jgi:hypothetical protein
MNFELADLSDHLSKFKLPSCWLSKSNMFAMVVNEGPHVKHVDTCTLKLLLTQAGLFGLPKHQSLSTAFDNPC